ncbi:hypothetical protein EK21DRAFT_55727, partial [Setomelanomma holmii]
TLNSIRAYQNIMENQIAHHNRNSSYKLVIEQQPIRARMCGFGDKDRRPITPPPCVRLVIRDESGRELTETDCTFFVLTVDLWSEDGLPGYGYPPAPAHALSIPHMSAPAAPSQNHTRNLIGMNAVNACQLNDLDGKKSFWFILQDLSVRTEGTFRLKLSMVDVGAGNGSVSTGKCPILCTVFSEPFTVYSAKKFPGVIESTPLSKCFAQQGIKIPIRKDGPKNLANQSEFDNDD